MQIVINQKKSNLALTTAFIITKKELPEKASLSKEEIKFVKKEIKKDKDFITINQYNRKVYFILLKDDTINHLTKEKFRKYGYQLCTCLEKDQTKEITLFDNTNHPELLMATAEGIALSNYRFIKYFKDVDKKTSKLTGINIYSNLLTNQEGKNLQTLVESVWLTRDLINEPVSYLNAVKLAEIAQEIGLQSNLSVRVMDKPEIEKEQMGGLLAVNQGSIDPPRFIIMEWKPDSSKNKQPLVLVGKGVVFDTGGLSLKPTPNSMDYMKMDMSGAAAVIGVMRTLALTNSSYHVVGLIPATDNRLSGNAYAPGDVVKMKNGLTVEVLNTDAEGRMILADALTYADNYKPELIINMATLTGAAAAAIGHFGMVAMGNAPKNTFQKLSDSGFETFERLVEFPFWDDYKELLKSDIADLKNVGGKEGGSITAGKFLEHFTQSPFIHLDIAGPAYLHATDSYRGKGGTGYCVRLLIDFIEKL